MMRGHEAIFDFVGDCFQIVHSPVSHLRRCSIVLDTLEAGRDRCFFDLGELYA